MMSDWESCSRYLRQCRFNCLGVPIAPEDVARELLGVSKKEFE